MTDEHVDEILKHFGGADPEVGNLEYKELSPDLLAEYEKVHEKVATLKQIEEMLKRNILKLMGKEENVHRGTFAVFLKPRTTATIEWAKYVEDELGIQALQELEETKEQVKKGKATSKYVKITESRVLEVKRLDGIPDV